jgi:L-asparaginase
MALLILSTGGTFEKVYCPSQGRLWFNGSRLEHWASQCCLPKATRLETIMLVDSLEMTTQQRQNIAEHVFKAPEDRVVVIHGTDTMTDTARVVCARQRSSQTVVFTGAMIPASQPDTDALFNLGMAVAASQILEPGQYICMSGAVFDANHVRKDIALGRFTGALLANAKRPKDHSE